MSSVTFDELYQSAKQVVNPRQLSTRANAGSVGAAILSISNTIYVGVCIDTTCSMGFCAEHAAAASMITAGEHRILTDDRGWVIGSNNVTLRSLP